MRNNPIVLDFSYLDQVVDSIIESNQKLIYFAGASASGKSFIAEKLTKSLQEQGKKVLLISSDSYYSNESQLKYLLYGTFDHPKLINYGLLERNLHEFFNHGSFQLPVYSFIEKRTVDYITIDQQYDIIIVEGLYSIHSLSKKISTATTEIMPYNIVVNAPVEEIIFRRLVRDQKRVNEPIHALIDVMANVFPMWKIFGETQKKYADCIINNNYSIFDKEGRKSQRKQIEKKDLPDTDPYDIHHTNNYIYDDGDYTTSGRIVISEIYRKDNDLLDHVVLQKRSSDPREEQKSYESINMSLYKPGIVTELHTLLQLAGLSYHGNYKKTIYYYNKPNEIPVIIKEKGNNYYQLIT